MNDFIFERQKIAWEKALSLLKPSAAQLEHGLELHRELFVTDHFGFLPSVCYNKKFVDKWNELKAGNIGARELAERMTYFYYDCCCSDEKYQDVFRRAMRNSGLNCMIHTVAEGKSREEDIKRMSCNLMLFRKFRDTIVQAGNADDILKINAEGKVAILWSVNGPPIVGELQDPDQELNWVDVWRRIGVRLMHLTYNRRNFIADGCGEPANAGLSELGRELIAKLNECGIIVDVPHTGKQSCIEAAKASSKPIMASHTAAKALFDYIRCKDDETLKAIADTGGMVGVYSFVGMLGGNDDINTMLDHIEYIAKTIGVDHVGIGTDNRFSAEQCPEYSTISGYPNARFNPHKWWGIWKKNPHTPKNPLESSSGSLAWSNWPLFTVGLVCRGFSDEDIAKMHGRNFLRVLRANECES